MGKQPTHKPQPRMNAIGTFIVLLLLGGLLASTIGCAGLPRSAGRGEVSGVKSYLAQGQHVDSVDWKKRSGLELAIILQHDEVIDLLIAEGADVNRRGKKTRTPLIWASMRWGTPELIHKLIAAGADPNGPDAAGQTPLYYSVLFGTREQTAALIKGGALVNQIMQPKWRAPVLAAAIRRDNHEAVEQLVAAGADLNLVDSKGNDARTQAARRPGMLYAIDRGLERRKGGTQLASATRSSPAPQKAAKPAVKKKAKAKPKPKPVTQAKVQAKPKPAPKTTKAKPKPAPAPAPKVQPRQESPAPAPVKVAAPTVAPRAAPFIAPAVAPRPEPVQVARVAPRRKGKDLRLGEYHALVIGNNDYDHLPDLKTAVNDAKAMSSLLRDRYGYNVTTLVNATRSEILQALSRYRKILSEQDNLLIYYAGHGWLDEDADQGYWLPVDATQEDDVFWIANEAVTSKTRAMEAKHVMVIADSCYSGKLVRGIHVNQATPNYLKRLATRRARVVLTSGGIEPVSDSGGRDNHSVFAAALLQALEDNSDVMEGHELFTKVRRPVAVNSDQIPEYSDIRKAGHDGGDFLFIVP